MSDVLHAGAHEWARDEAIRAFLRSRPDFIREDPDLMRDLGLRPDVAPNPLPSLGNVIEFGPAAISRVEKARKRETNVRRQLEAVARANFDAQAQAHDAAIHLMGAADHADLAGRLDDIARGFGLVAAVIALEGPEGAPDGWRPLAEGQCDLTVGRRRVARLGVVPTALGLFGDMAEEIGSVALLRLAVGAPPRAGVLAFASHAPDAFSPDMGHELIDFLARVVERTAERWPTP